jgi:predicted ArsR family transcriptional regulator
LCKFWTCVLNIGACKVPHFRSSPTFKLMNQRLISEIGRTQRLDIINSLKRTKGMSVNELVEKMGMSYMGIKQHCITLHRDGYLDTWRRPQKMGRPEMVYRLTRRTHDLFQAESHQFTLDLLKAAEEIYGPNAPEKLLYNAFRKKTAALKAKAKGDTVADRAKWLAHVRDAEGYMAEFVNNNNDGGPHILECHSPILNVLERCPIVGRFEQDMFEAVLGTRVRREVIRNSGLYECVFQFAA